LQALRSKKIIIFLQEREIYMQPISGIQHYPVRQRRFTEGRVEAWAQDWALFGLDSTQTLDWTKIFTRAGPIVMEIGFGNGEHLCHQATNMPEKNFLGVELYRPGVGALMSALQRESLTNVRIFAEDVQSVIAQAIPDGLLSTVHILFPDPWPKRRHHRRRIIQPAFIAQLVQKLQPGGQLHFATDWAPYAEYIVQVLSNEPSLSLISTLPTARVETKFERRGKALGHAIVEQWYVRV